MWRRYDEYLTDFKDEAYRDHVFGYIEQEDMPKSLIYQLNPGSTVARSNWRVHIHKPLLNRVFTSAEGRKGVV